MWNRIEIYLRIVTSNKEKKIQIALHYCTLPLGLQAVTLDLKSWGFLYCITDLYLERKIEHPVSNLIKIGPRPQNGNGKHGPACAWAGLETFHYCQYEQRVIDAGLIIIEITQFSVGLKTFLHLNYIIMTCLWEVVVWRSRCVSHIIPRIKVFTSRTELKLRNQVSKTSLLLCVWPICIVYNYVHVSRDVVCMPLEVAILKWRPSWNDT